MPVAGRQRAHLETQSSSLLSFKLYHVFVGGRSKLPKCLTHARGSYLVALGGGQVLLQSLVKTLCFLNWSCSSQYPFQKISSAKQDNQEFIAETVGFMQYLGLLVMDHQQQVGQQFLLVLFTKSVISLLHTCACESTEHL